MVRGLCRLIGAHVIVALSFVFAGSAAWGQACDETTGSGSALARAAANLAVGAACEMDPLFTAPWIGFFGGTPSGTTACNVPGGGASADVTTCDVSTRILCSPSSSVDSIAPYSNNMAWDGIRNELRFDARTHGNCGERHIIYSEATDTWRTAAIASVAGAGNNHHGYDWNAVNPATGYSYIMNYGQATNPGYVWEWNPDALGGAGQWSFYTDTGISGSSTSGALEWFPERNEIMAFRNTLWRSRIGGTWTTLLDLSVTDKAGTLLYVDRPSNTGAVVLVTEAGNVWRYDPGGGTPGTRPDAPCSGGNDSNRSDMVPDHAGGKIIMRCGSESWYAYDPWDDTAPAFTQISSGFPPFGPNSQNDTIGTGIAEYGVMVFLDESAGSLSNGGGMWLYKYSSSTPPVSVCNDTIDNDSDGIADYPNDRGCSSADDDDERFWESGAPPVAVATITVKESASVGATDYPITAVVPLTPGQFLGDTAGFALYDDTLGDNIPAQFNVLERDTIGDNSILHVAVTFYATVTSGQVDRTYRFYTGGENPTPVQTLSANLAAGVYTVSTGATGGIQYTVPTTGYNILNEVWYDLDNDGYETAERIILPSASHGGNYDGCSRTNRVLACATDTTQDLDSELLPPTCAEDTLLSGPLQYVIRCESPSVFSDADGSGTGGDYHRHGYATRIWSWAGKPWIKIDQQLQNAAKGPALNQGKFGDTMYFNSYDLNWELQLGATPTVAVSTGNAIANPSLASGVQQAITMHDEWDTDDANDLTPTGSKGFSCTDGVQDATNSCDDPLWVDVRTGTWGVQAIIRNAWQTWPNGIEVADNTATPVLSLQLWPDWSSQWDYRTTNAFTTSGLYWLDDMRAVYKETLLNFHGATPTNTVLDNLARNFDRHPVPTLPLSHYNSTAVTMDGLGKTERTSVTGTAGALETYSSNTIDQTQGNYRMGWNWYYDALRGRHAYPDGAAGDVCAPGSGPPTVDWFFGSGTRSDYWHAERVGIGSLNSRPVWLPGYDYETEAATIGPTPKDYCEGWWRAPNPPLTWPIAGTSYMNAAPDEQHIWTYHVWQSYWAKPNPWIRDWAQNVGEIIKISTDPTPGQDWPTRSLGHSLKDLLGAYRVTGDVSFWNAASGALTSQHSGVHPKCGHLADTSVWTAYPDPYNHSNSGVQNGFYTRQIINFMEHTLRAARATGTQADWNEWAVMFSHASAFINWVVHWGRFPGGASTATQDCEIGGNSSTGWIAPDNVAAWYWRTGLQSYLTSATTYASQDDIGNPEGPLTNGDGESYQTVPDGQDTYRVLPKGVADPNRAITGEWDGRWASRTFHYVQRTAKADSTAPAAVAGLAANKAGSTVTVTWTEPTEDTKYYLIVWADRQLENCTSNCSSDPESTNTTTYRNWWAAEPVACGTGLCVGSATIANAATAAYVGVFSFDANDNMSAMATAPVLGAGTCGNGVLDGGEDCDTALSPTCCESNCTFSLSSTPCASDGDACTADFCSGTAATCVNTLTCMRVKGVSMLGVVVK